MDLDADIHLAAVERQVTALEREGQPAHAVRLARSYATTLDDLWDAVTNAERIPQWFLPVSGNLELGGHYQLEGNAGGKIVRCEPPSHLALTWEFGEDLSWVEVDVSDDSAGRARLALTHTALVTPHWAEFGPGAVGVGWEMGLLGMALHLAHPHEPKLDAEAFAASAEGRALLTGSSEAWGRAAVAMGMEPDEAQAAARRTAGFYTGEAVEAG